MTGTARSTRSLALVTGASSGIGEALAACFARDGHDLVLVARSKDKLQALASQLESAHDVKVIVLAADLSLPGAVAALAASLKRRRLVVDMLVNNAGVLAHGAFCDIDPQRHQQLIDLNIGALTSLLAQFVPGMRERGFGRVLNVASIAAFQPVPTLATYAATKAYVLSLSESLAEELRGSGVTVTALCPGITATQMLDTATLGSEALSRLPAFLIGDVQNVAMQGYLACMRGEVIQVPGVLNRMGTLAARATPKWLLRKLSGEITRRSL
ncbi:MAG: SDR family oxidoreductase [Rubrivivax sp.]